MNIDGKAVAPLLGGLAADGPSILCTWWASRLMNELRNHEGILRNDEVHQAVAQDSRAQGLDVEPRLEFELVLLEDLATTPELIAVLTAERCISRNLCRRGFVIVDKKTRSPVAIHDTGLMRTATQ